MNAIEKQFEHHFQVIRSERFRQGLGLGNEVPFFISSYPPEQQIQVDESISYLLKRLNQEGISVKLIDLFEFCNRVGSVLDLFGILNEDRYYRAFSLNEYQI